MNNAAVGRGYDPQSWTFATGKIKLYASINMSPRYDNYIILYIYIYICLTCFSLTSISLITYWYILSGNPDLPTCILSCYRSGNSLTSPATYPYVSWIFGRLAWPSWYGVVFDIKKIMERDLVPPGPRPQAFSPATGTRIQSALGLKKKASCIMFRPCSKDSPMWFHIAECWGH